MSKRIAYADKTTLSFATNPPPMHSSPNYGSYSVILDLAHWILIGNSCTCFAAVAKKRQTVSV